MLVPVVRKAIRITIIIIGALYVAEMTVGTDKVKTILLGAGVGGIAIALAAKDTIANIFGSITIFADRPFQIDDLVKINGFYWTKPADYGLSHEVNQRVNFEIMKRFEEAQIEFAFPTQTLYLKKDDLPAT